MCLHSSYASRVGFAIPTDDHTSEWHYEEDLLECMSHSKDGCMASNATDALLEAGKHQVSCVWCTYAPSKGVCLSEEAAHNMDGPVYTCEWPGTTGDVLAE